MFFIQIQNFIDNLGLKASTRKAAKDKKKTNESPDEQTHQKETSQTTITATTVHLDKQLMSVSAKPLKRMLASIDTEQMWYDQVSPSVVILQQN